jgi:hypothetical protein
MVKLLEEESDDDMPEEVSMKSGREMAIQQQQNERHARKRCVVNDLATVC